MDENYTLFNNIYEKAPLPEEGILSRPLFSNETQRHVLFAMSEGQELTEHTTSMEATLHILQGTAEITLGGDSHTVVPGAWLHMPPRLPHSVKATTPLVMLLSLLKK